jgi:hypothetical protein
MPGTPMQRLASTRGSTVGATGSGGEGGGEEGEERLGNFEFHLLGEEDDDDDAEDGREARAKGFRLLPAGLGSPKLGSGKKKGGEQGGVKSDVDIYNIINAEEKDNTGAGGKRRKGLALGQAIAHSMKAHLYGETAGSKSTKHPPAAFTQTKATDVTFQDVTFSFQVGTWVGLCVGMYVYVEKRKPGVRRAMATTWLIPTYTITIARSIHRPIAQEYAPPIFLSIREHFGIDNETYLKSMAELKGGQVRVHALSRGHI